MSCQACGLSQGAIDEKESVKIIEMLRIVVSVELRSLLERNDVAKFLMRQAIDVDTYEKIKEVYTPAFRNSMAALFSEFCQ